VKQKTIRVNEVLEYIHDEIETYLIYGRTIETVARIDALVKLETKIKTMTENI